LLRLDADTGAQRYVPATVRSAATAGKLVIKNCVATWQAYNTWGGYDLYTGPGAGYPSRSVAVSLDRPYDLNGSAPAGRGQRADLGRPRRVLDPGRARPRDRGP
jgi:hypothetical protein